MGPNRFSIVELTGPADLAFLSSLANNFCEGGVVGDPGSSLTNSGTYAGSPSCRQQRFLGALLSALLRCAQKPPTQLGKLFRLFL